jgi:Na+-transporting NADH:ubiquinone oxidoreductase subunit F
MSASGTNALVEILAGVLILVVVVTCLATVVLLVQGLLAPKGAALVTVNGRLLASAPCGQRLLEALADRGVFMPASCGGTGGCGLCRVRVVAGGGSALPTETVRLSPVEIAAGWRLACQVTLRNDVAIELPDELLGVKTLTCTVRSTRSVSTFMKEIVLALPPDERLDFRAGAFVLLHCPPFRVAFADFEIGAEYRDEWDQLGLLSLVAGSTTPVTRAYSLANHPGESGIAQLVVRIATPPPRSDPEVPPGIVSSYVFGLIPNDRVTISGPFGNFTARDSEREMVFVGGGAGMAPMRAHILDQLVRLRTPRRIRFWYGARSRRELFYGGLFDRLAAEHDNFAWTVVLSEPRPEDDWDGPVGYVHRVLGEQYLQPHPHPEECEYYLCGPPLMIQATRQLLDEFGVPPAHVHFDDFGGG